MNPSAIIAFTAMRKNELALDVTSNNLANLETIGYKAKEAAFSDLFFARLAQPAELTQDQTARLTAEGLRVGNGSRLSGIFTNWTLGKPLETGQPLDFFLQGNAFFEVMGVDGAMTYTRNGHFKLTPAPDGSAQMWIVNERGERLMGQDANQNAVPLVIPSGEQDFQVDEQGYILLQDKAGGQTGLGIVNPDGTVAPGVHISLVRIAYPEVLESAGEGRYRIPQAVLDGVQAGDPPLVEQVLPAVRMPETVTLKQGYLESANVDLIREMSQLLAAQRAYQLNARVLTSAEQMMGMANSLRGS